MITELLWLIVGIVLGATGVLFWSRTRIVSLKTLLEVQRKDGEEKQKELEKREHEFLLQSEQSRQENALRLEKAESTAEELNRQKELLNRENRALTADKQTMERELSLLHERIKHENEEQNRKFNERLRFVQEQLQNSARELLTQRSRELSENNNQQISAIVNPLKDSIREMRSAMDTSRDINNKNTASIEKYIEELMKHSQEIGNKADNLAMAMRGKNKTQGNWGELVLTVLLENQGLIEGVHFDVQKMLTDGSGNAVLNEESNKRMIPDVVVHFPDKKDVIIDSKVSLSAFIDMQGAVNEQLREEALDRHVQSLRDHVKELSRKDYSSYLQSTRQSIDYVIMFVPNESALQAALSKDSGLWRESFERHVFITGEQNLMAALSIIRLAWVHELQVQNQHDILEWGTKLLDRVSEFSEHLENVGRKLEQAKESYDKARNKLTEGKQSIAGAARKLQDLGVKNKKSLPETF